MQRRGTARIPTPRRGGLTEAPEFSLRSPVWVQTPDSQPTKVGTSPQLRTVPHKH